MAKQEKARWAEIRISWPAVPAAGLLVANQLVVPKLWYVGSSTSKNSMNIVVR